jgi:DNA modification methylase
VCPIPSVKLLPNFVPNNIKIMILEWSTEQRKVNELLPLEINPRKITEAKRMKMIESIQKFNLVDIPVIDTDGTIISGHQRMRALQAIGRGEELIDVRIPNRKLTTKELKEYNILANQHFGEFDMEVMDLEFKDLDFEDIGVDMKAIEFEQSDMFEKSKVKFEIEKERKAQVIYAKEDDFDTTPPAQPFKVLGDMYEIGEHRLLCGDSTDSDQVCKLMNGEKADMVFTDPPYNVKISGLGSGSAPNSIGKIHGEFKMASGEMTKKEFTDFLTQMANNLILFSKNGSIHYLCMDWRHITELTEACVGYSELKNLCIWNKDNGGMGAFYRSKHELVFVYKNGTEKHINNFELGQFGRYRTNVWDYPIVSSFTAKERINNKSAGNSETAMHPTVKPLRLVVDCIQDCSNKEHNILDLFGGSGTTMVAAHQSERIGYLMELEPNYCDVIVKRMHKLDPSLRIIRNGIDITDTIDTL